MMEEEPESARPEEGKPQDGKWHPSPSAEMEESQGLSVAQGTEGRGHMRFGDKEAMQQRDKGMRATLQEPETTCWCFPSQETLKGIRRLKRRHLMTK